jgi:hypothetical protein
MKVEVICRENNLREMLGIKLLNYREAIEAAFAKIGSNMVASKWTDALSSEALYGGITGYLEVPVYGCYSDRKKLKVKDAEKALTNMLSIGGETGWYYGDWLWGIRGFIDRLSGGVGLRRGRKNRTDLSPGDALDFWRVLIADKAEKRLLLFAEMKLPGEAWLEFRIDRSDTLYQTATFRPLGVFGRLYWFAMLPFHLFIFRGMIRRIAGV